MTRRTAIGAMCAGAAGFVLFGPSRTRSAPPDRLVLDYWEKWTGHEGRAMQRVIDLFNESQDRIWVRYLATNAIDQKTMTAIAGGAPPDVVGLWNYNLPAYADSRAILPLDELGPEFGVRLENYALGYQQAIQYKGRMWATVNTGGTIAMYYNRAMFREVGLDPDRPPRTIEELDEAHERLLKVDAQGNVTRAGFIHREPGWWSWLWGYHFGGPLYDEASNELLATATHNLRAFEWVQSYPEALPAGALDRFRATFGNYDSPLNAFLAGKVGMAIQGPWLANVINAYAPELDYGVAPFPTIEAIYDPAAPVGLIDCDVLVIPRGVRHPEASMEFIAFTQRREIVEMLSTVHCKNSPLAESSEAFLTEHPNRGVRVHDAIAKSARAFLVPETRAWPELKTLFDISFDRIWTLSAPASAILDIVDAEGQAVLDRTAEQQRRRDAQRDDGGVSA